MEHAVIGLLSFTAGVIVMAICKVKINESEAEDRGYDKGFDEGVLIAKSAMEYIEQEGVEALTRAEKLEAIESMGIYILGDCPGDYGLFENERCHNEEACGDCWINALEATP